VTREATMGDVRDRTDAFKQALKDRGFKETAQRDDIARVFFGRQGGHVSIDELHNEVKKVNPRVGYATVHRTVRLLKEMGFAAERHFDDGQARYEQVDDDGEHHDHLICERCRRIVEFRSDEMDVLQGVVADALGFVVSRRRVEFYGICRECREGRDMPELRGTRKKIHKV
jgi:Fur family ferric uptake transcriptional regulator